MHFSTEETLEIIDILKNRLKSNNEITFKVLNPDIKDNLYSGEKLLVDNKIYIYRSYKSWVDLAQILRCKVKTPRNIGNLVEITFKKLDNFSFHTCNDDNDKYGISSEFFKIDKMQEPSFIYYYQDALHRADINRRKEILNLGINRGDEFKIVKTLVELKNFNSMNLVGIDYSKSAIDYAKRRFKDKNISFICADINKIEELNLNKFDMFISIGTLQSSSIKYKELLMNLVTNYLKRDSAIILGFPNCRWIGGEMLYGARVPNYNFSEMGHLFSDVIFAKKYLQQKKYRVTITGKDYIFLTATKIRSALV